MEQEETQQSSRKSESEQSKERTNIKIRQFKPLLNRTKPLNK